MRKKHLIICFIIVLISICGCNMNKSISKNNNKNIKWEQAYNTYLEDICKKNNMVEYFLKDMDNDDIPNLVVKLDEKLIIYSYENSLIELGKYDFVTGTTRFLYSDNPSYPGIFYFYESGGINYYGYITIVDKKLSIENLWNEDYSGISKEIGEERDKIIEESDDKKLIDESFNVYKHNNDIPFEIYSNDISDSETSLKQTISDIQNKDILAILKNEKKYYNTELNEYAYLKNYSSTNYMYPDKKGKYKYHSDPINMDMKVDQWCEVDLDNDGKTARKRKCCMAYLERIVGIKSIM